ncbi:MAG: hypothetical protein HC875_08930 [Anaerolineales bacterium]|nr:hypothetical protein [Anaerolineales bacterium]
MPRKQKPQSSQDQKQLSFDDIIKTGQVFSREEVEAEVKPDDSQGYDPIARTADYMQRSVKFEEAWETTIQKARIKLLEVDAREIYLDFLTDLKQQIEQNSPKSARLAGLLKQVAQRGLGIPRQLLDTKEPPRGGTRWRVEPFKADLIQTHLDNHIVGENFLNEFVADNNIWQGRNPIIGASDVSQHRSAVPVPARFFKRSVPFVLNNAAGTLFTLQSGKPKYDNLFNPKPDEALLRWMLIDPSYQDDLDPEDYQRCLASAMDVGQYKFDLDYLFKLDKRIDVIFRDGSLFPQDAYLDNFVKDNRRGEFTRQAIVEMSDCLGYAKRSRIVYCGVAKNVQLKVYSAIVDWYIERNIDKDWGIANYTLNDGQAMSLLLASPSFLGDNLSQVVSTCLIRRSFTTRANLNTRIDLDDLDAYIDGYQKEYTDLNLDPYRELCKMAHVYMFFIGHSKSPQQQLPRYEFFCSDYLGPVLTATQKILSALQLCTLMSDEDHSFMADKPVTYLIPAVTQQAHLLSKDVGKYIDTATGQWIMARYRGMLQKTT